MRYRNRGDSFCMESVSLSSGKCWIAFEWMDKLSGLTILMVANWWGGSITLKSPQGHAQAFYLESISSMVISATRSCDTILERIWRGNQKGDENFEFGDKPALASYKVVDPNRGSFLKIDQFFVKSTPWNQILRNKYFLFEAPIRLPGGGEPYGWNWDFWI